MSEQRHSGVEFFRHSVGDEEIAAVADAMRGPLLTRGAVVETFERELSAHLGNGVRTLGTSSCTAALHLSLLACDVRPGDDVVTTPLTFIASANVILHAGATPIFADVEPRTGLIDPGAVEAAMTPRTKAVLAVHLYGQLADVARLRAICDASGASLVEDAAHAIEAIRDGHRAGHLGDAAAFSFYATKNITSGEGGAFATRSGERLDRARLLSQHGMSAAAADRSSGSYRHWDMLALGYKYNMTNLQAAMLRPQLARIEEMREKREALAARYEAAFANVDGLDFPGVVPGATSARHLFTLWAPDGRRDAYLAGLNARGIGTAVNYRAIHLLTYYKERLGLDRGRFPIAESIGDRTLSLPLYPSLSFPEQDRVIEAVLDVHRAG